MHAAYVTKVNFSKLSIAFAIQNVRMPERKPTMHAPPLGFSDWSTIQRLNRAAAKDERQSQQSSSCL